MASTFSTASTAATIPITLRSLERLGVSRQSSQLTACIGTNFNNDGTALYQATAALFMAQALGYSLSLVDQVVIVLTTLVASVGAGGIPSGSFVTLPLIFAAVRLPADKIPILLTVDWFLDRCRTTSNVLGDMTVAVLLDRVWHHDSRRPIARIRRDRQSGREDHRGPPGKSFAVPPNTVWAGHDHPQAADHWLSGIPVLIVRVSCEEEFARLVVLEQDDVDALATLEIIPEVVVLFDDLPGRASGAEVLFHAIVFQCRDLPKSGSSETRSRSMIDRVPSASASSRLRPSSRAAHLARAIAGRSGIAGTV